MRDAGKRAPTLDQGLPCRKHMKLKTICPRIAMQEAHETQDDMPKPFKPAKMKGGLMKIRNGRFWYTLAVALEIICFRPSFSASQAISFSTKEKQELVDAHNSYRKAQGGANMRLMRWDEDLEKMCLGFGDKCFEHSSQQERKNEKYNGAGENIHGRTNPTINLTEVVYEQWGDQEKKNYNYLAGRCTGGMCGHYTQEVWWQSYGLGCCLQPKEIPCTEYDQYLFVRCEYGPAGNVNRYKPFAQGEPCSKCVPESPPAYPLRDFDKFSKCVCGLCSDMDLKEGCNPKVPETSETGGKDGKDDKDGACPGAAAEVSLVVLVTLISTTIL